MRRFLYPLVIASCLALLGCEAPAAPELSNRRDPLFDGPPGGRIPNTPGNVRLTDSDLHTLTFEWEDRSSFDVGTVVWRTNDLTGMSEPYHQLSEVVEAPATTWTDRPPVIQPYGYWFFATASEHPEHHTSRNHLGGASNLLQLFVSYSTRFLGPDQHAVVSAIAYSPDGTRLAVANFGRIEIWDLSEERLLCAQTVEDRESFFADVAFSSDGALLAAGSIQGLHVVRTRDCSLVRTTAIAPPHTRRVAFHPSGTLVATVSVEVVQVWRVSDGSVVAELEPVGSEVGPYEREGFRPLTAAFSPDGSVLAIATERRVSTWQTEDWSAIHAFQWPSGERPNSAAFSPDLDRLAVTFYDPIRPHQLRVLDLPSGALLSRTVGGSHLGYRPLVFSPDGRYVAFAQSDTLHVHEAATGERLASFRDAPRYPQDLRAFAFSPDQRYVAAGYRADYKPEPLLTMWELDGAWSVDSTRVHQIHDQSDLPPGGGFAN